MRTVRTKVYKFSELSEPAKERALEDFITDADFTYDWNDEAMDSLKGFAEHFGAELSDWSVNWDDSGQSWASFDTSNLYDEDGDYGNEWLKEKIESMGSYNPETLKGLGDCKFTGYCMDESAADGARIAYSNGERSLNGILQAGFKTWLKDCQTDYEYQNGMEYFKEHCEANDYEFTQDGIRF